MFELSGRRLAAAVSVFVSLSLWNSLGCTSRHLVLRTQTRPAPEAASTISLSLQFQEDDARTLGELHDSYQGYVRYLDSDTPSPHLERVQGKVAAGVPVALGPVKRLPKVQVGLDLFQGEKKTYQCESGVTNLAITLEPAVTLPLSCMRLDSESGPHSIEVNPIVVVLRETIDISASVDGASAVERAMAMASSTSLQFTQEGSYAGEPARFELRISPKPGRAQPSLNIQVLATKKSDGGRLIDLSSVGVAPEAVRSFLSGAVDSSLTLAGVAQVTGRAPMAPQDGSVPPAGSQLLLPVSVRLRAPRGAEWVQGPKGREVRLAFVADFVTIDGVAPQPPVTFSGEWILQEESPLPETITVATYNMEGMADDIGTGFPWDYSASQSNWIKDKMYAVKARHLAEVLTLAGTPDIVALEEVKYMDGNGRPAELLLSELAPLGYRYKAVGPQRRKGERNQFPSDTVVFMSKFPIVSMESLPFDSLDASGAARDPLAVTVDVGGNLLRLYAVHTRSKRSERTPADTELGDSLRRGMLAVVRADIDRVRERDSSTDIIVMGDMNANYFESPIRQGLLTTGAEEKMLARGNDEPALYELWSELPVSDRCGTVVGGKRECIDQIMISSSLYDKNGFQYVDNSFRIVGSSGPALERLVGPGGNPIRWETRSSPIMVEGRERNYITHLGVGYSDHLPLVATLRVVGRTGDFSRMALATAPSPQMDHVPGQLFAHIRNCTGNDGEFLSSANPLPLDSSVNFSLPEMMGRCFSLSGGAVPMKIVDTYDTRNDFGFEFVSTSSLFKTVTITIQFGDMNPGGRAIDRNGIMALYATQLKTALDAGKAVLLTSFKGRLGMSYGKLTLYAEELPGLQIVEGAPPPQ